MAVPIQVAQEKKASPESPKPSTSEAEPSAEYITPGNGCQDSLKKLTSYWYQALSQDVFPLPPKKCRKSRTAIYQVELLKVPSSKFKAFKKFFGIKWTYELESHWMWFGPGVQHQLHNHSTVLSPSCSGKVNQTSVSLAEEAEVVMSSSQQPAKTFKVGGSQVTVVTKPAPVSSATHISQAVRTQITELIFFTFTIITGFFSDESLQSKLHQTKNKEKKN